MMQFRGIDITSISMTTRDLMREASRTHRDAPYLTYVPRGTVDTFGAFEAKVNRIANLLRGRYGIGPGDKVCTMAENVPELLYTIMAVTNLGALWVPINNALVGESLRYVVEHSDAGTVCVSGRYVDTVERALSGGTLPARLLPIPRLVEESAGLPDDCDCPASPDDPSMILFTSGTTGFPKGVLHTHTTYIRTGVRGLEVLGTDETHRIHLYLPFCHGWAYLLMLGSLYYRCQLIMEDTFHAESYWDTIQRYGVTQDHWTGTVPLKLMKAERQAVEDTASFGVIGTFGALYSQMKARWPNLRFHSLYGMTEHPFMTEVPPGHIKPGSDGIPKYPDDILTVDEAGQPVATGEVGEIVCRCRCGVVMKGYYKNPEATAHSLKGNDLYTGDLGRLDAEGHLAFVGRKKDALRVRGEMVSVEHIEHLINRHPAVAESAIVGYRPAEKEALREDEIVAHLVLQPGATLTPGAFQDWARENLARFMMPRYLVFRDALPKTATERAQRFKLRDEGLGNAIRLF